MKHSFAAATFLTFLMIMEVTNMALAQYGNLDDYVNMPENLTHYQNVSDYVNRILNRFRRTLGMNSKI